MKNTKAPGFTLVELLVVIAIIGILIAMLLPAVQAAREAARRMQCSNNFKQMALAAHNYHGLYSVLPYGAHASQSGTWFAALLPYLEEETLGGEYKSGMCTVDAAGVASYLPSYFYNAGTNRDITSQRIASATCPSDQPRTVGSSRPMTYHNVAANYGNIGYHSQLAGPLKTLGTLKFGGAPFVMGAHGQGLDAFRFGEITDGLSTTLLFSEVIQGDSSNSYDFRGFTWWGQAAGFMAYNGPNSPIRDVMVGNNYCDPTNPSNPPCDTVAQSYPGRPAQTASRSRHPGGVNSCMADGSTQFFSDNIDIDLWRALSTIRGEEAIGSLDQEEL